MGRHNIRRSGDWIRPDITGLRVLAIVPVVAFHAGLPGVSGGFVGVDVFYVISGFLITSNLLRESEASGRVRLARFWAKRARRLVPASALMVAVTLPFAMHILSPLDWSALGKQSAAALLYWSNFLFAGQATDYFAADIAAPSPYLHTWSLGVEEQFYLLWPLLIIGAIVLARRGGWRLRPVLFVAFTVTMASSLALSLVWTHSRPADAFYLLPTRAWQFAAAGMLALLPAHIVGPRRMRVAMGVIGAAGLTWAVVQFSSSTPFPGTAALLPVAATMLIIAGGRARDGESPLWTTRTLSVAPMQWVGNMSYSWYLWHWPLIVLAAAEYKTESVGVKTIAAVLSLVVAAAAHYLVENPIRFHPRLARSTRLTFATILAMTMLVAVLPAYVEHRGSQAVAQNKILKQAQSEVPQLACTNKTEPILDVQLCEFGDLTSAKTVVLVGDSHAGQWINALASAAQKAGIRLLTRWKTSCPAIGIRTRDTNGNWNHDCVDYTRQTLAIIETLHPVGVLISQAEAYFGRIVGPHNVTLTAADQRLTWQTAYDATLSMLNKAKVKVGVILDNPRLHYDPNDCLVTTNRREGSCESSQDAALDSINVLQSLSRDVISHHDVTAVFETTPELCDGVHCKVIDRGIPVYRDYNHLSRLWTLGKVPQLVVLLTKLV